MTNGNPQLLTGATGYIGADSLRFLIVNVIGGYTLMLRAGVRLYNYPHGV
jgi:thioester reductase-like protein